MEYLIYNILVLSVVLVHRLCPARFPRVAGELPANQWETARFKRKLVQTAPSKSNKH